MLNDILDAVISAMTNVGINAVSKYPGAALDRSETTVAVSVKHGQLSGSGCGNYLGTRESGGEISELYGCRAELEIAMDIYTAAPPEEAEKTCLDLLDELCTCVGEIDGVRLVSLSCGDVHFDAQTEMLRCDASLSLLAFLVAEGDGAGGFTDFVLRGVLK